MKIRFYTNLMGALFCTLVSCSIASAQEKFVKYLDKNSQVLPDENGAAYYRTVEGVEGKYVVRDYYISKQIEMVAECAKYDPYMFLIGKKTDYFENGKVKSESNYVNNVQRGLSKTYYPSGNEKAQINYDNKRARYISYLADDGSPLLPGGNGVIRTDSSDTGAQFEEIVNSELFGSFTISTTGDTTYIIVEHPAEYQGGNAALAGELQKLVRYPSIARLRGTEGVVFVAFVVDKNGLPTELQIVKGVSPECDAEALDAVKHLTHWTPAEHRGKKHKARFVLPISFRLAASKKRK